ncbi:MAG TPA: PD-(D/E)XK nuclease-like domain-containing protein [Candidatus Binatia bacterium]|nr:PD-(D/E)XK nuclease-like domain-containing protein [Candidatus Binatia bacterium]
MIAKLLDISPDEYHRRPGLSSSTARTLLERSPLHAWTEHGAYGAKGKPPTKATDLGSVGHALVLGKGARFVVLPYEDYRKAAAQAARDEVRAAGLIPLLEAEHAKAVLLANEVRIRLSECGIELDGTSEAVIEWHEESEHGPVLCRSMMDHVWLDDGRILDLKFVSDASMASVERSAERYGYAIQAAAYTRALSALRPEHAGRTEFVFAFCETTDPYAINLSTPSGPFYELGDRRWCRGVAEWSRCQKDNRWPAYGHEINRISPPEWVLRREGFIEEEM